MKIPIAQITDEIITEYNLRNKVHTDGAVYIEIQKGMYGLPQAGMLANKLLANVDSPSTGITKSTIPWVIGATCGDPSISRW